MTCKISELADSVIKADKMTVNEVIDFIGHEMETGSDVVETYHKLYEKAYGKVLTRDIAEKWVKSMAIPEMNSERTTGQKWGFETAVEVGNKVGMDWHEVSKIDFYVVLNMMYSDYYRTAKTIEKQNDGMFYANLAKEWLYDEDVINPENKLFNYYFHVVM